MPCFMIGKAGLQGLLGFGNGSRLANSASFDSRAREMRDHVISDPYVGDSDYQGWTYSLF